MFSAALTVDYIRLNSRQGLSSNLHFRQFKLPISELSEGFRRENAGIPMNFRQGNASRRGKEMIQVTGQQFESNDMHA